MAEVTVEYEIVRDQGGNLGLKCPKCGCARWSAHHDTTNWGTHAPCENCQAMLNQGCYAKETQNAKDAQVANEPAPQGVVEETINNEQEIQ